MLSRREVASLRIPVIRQRIGRWVVCSTRLVRSQRQKNIFLLRLAGPLVVDLGMDVCMLCVCFFVCFCSFFFLLFLCFTSTPNDLGSFNEENDSLVARAISNLELTRNIFFFNSTHKTSISTLEELFSSFEQTKKKVAAKSYTS